MYESHYGFSGSPFQLNPDPAFYFNSRGHGRALAYLQYGVAAGEGFIVITGEIGAGKTTLVRTLLDGLDRQKVLAAQIVSTQLESGELLQSILTAFGIPAQGNTKAHIIATLEAFFTKLAAQGRHALLIVDEAQNLSPKAVEELRMLSNFQLGNKSLLQSFLVGQPELRRLLESSSMEQLRQRVTASYHLGPLGVEETRSYIEHRLRRVGWTDRPAFTPGAMEQVYRWTAGIPRRINRLSNRLLLASFLDGSERITPELVRQTAEELRSEIGEGSFEPVSLPDGVATELAATERGGDEIPTVAPVVKPAAKSVAVPSTDGPGSPAPSAAAVAAVQSDASPVLEIDHSAARELISGETDVRHVADRLRRVGQVEPEAAHDVVRIEKFVPGRRRQVLLCVADTASAALRFAALAQAMETRADSPRMVLVNPGGDATVWPWEKMERLLPSLEVGLHLGAVGGSIASGTSVVFERFSHVLAEFSPSAVLTLGCSDGVLACAVLARQQEVPLVCLDGGDRSPRRDGSVHRQANAAILEQLSDLVFAVPQPAALELLSKLGIPPARVMAAPGLLEADAVASVWKEVTTPAGAFLRHGMSLYLGPTWSEHQQGTPYAVVAVSFQPGEEEQALRFCDVLAKVTSVPKVIWLLDRVTRIVLTHVLRQRADLAAVICLLVDGVPQDSALSARMARAVVLCREVRSLPEQLSILRGGSCAVVEPGQVLADAAELLDLPFVHLEADTLSLRNREKGVIGSYPLDPQSMNECLTELGALAPAPTQLVDVQHPQGAVAVVTQQLQSWLARRALQAGDSAQPAQPRASVASALAA